MMLISSGFRETANHVVFNLIHNSLFRIDIDFVLLILTYDNIRLFVHKRFQNDYKSFSESEFTMNEMIAFRLINI